MGQRQAMLHAMFRWLGFVLCLVALPLAHAVGPRVDTFYDTEEGRSYRGLNMLITWEIEPKLADVNAMFFFLFEQASATYEGGMAFANGIFGLRQQGRQRYVVFRISDTHLNAATAQPEREMRWCRRYQLSDESGVECVLEYEWRQGVVYMLNVSSKGQARQGGNDTWQASLIDIANDRETIIGRIEVDRVDKPLGYGGIRPNPVTYLEYFGASNQCAGQNQTRVSWLGPFDREGHPVAIGARSQSNECMATAVSSNGFPVVIQEGGVPSQRGLANGVDLWPLTTARYYRPRLSSDAVQSTPATVNPPPTVQSPPIQSIQPSPAAVVQPTAPTGKAANTPLWQAAPLPQNTLPQTSVPMLLPRPSPFTEPRAEPIEPGLRRPDASATLR